MSNESSEQMGHCVAGSSAAAIDPRVAGRLLLSAGFVISTRNAHIVRKHIGREASYLSP